MWLVEGVKKNIVMVVTFFVLILALIGLFFLNDVKEIPVDSEFIYEFRQDYERIKIFNISEQKADTVDMIISFEKDSNIVQISKKIYLDNKNEIVFAFDTRDIQKMDILDKSGINVQFKNPMAFEYGALYVLKNFGMLFIIIFICIIGFGLIIDISMTRHDYKN